jgi:hypothetical protein
VTLRSLLVGGEVAIASPEGVRVLAEDFCLRQEGARLKLLSVACSYTRPGSRAHRTPARNPVAVTLAIALSEKVQVRAMWVVTVYIVRPIRRVTVDRRFVVLECSQFGAMRDGSNVMIRNKASRAVFSARARRRRRVPCSLAI